MEGLVIIVSDAVTPEHLMSVEDGLNHFNDDVTGMSDRQPLSVVIRHTESGEILGGILGRSSLGTLFINLLYLPPTFRSMGLGSTLLERFEEEGRKRGCTTAFLYTLSFQAPDFYKKNGWEEFGRIDCLPEGCSRIFMRKTL